MKNSLLDLKIAFIKIKTQCWIDTEGKCYYLNLKQYFNDNIGNNICDIVSVHNEILEQINKYNRYNIEYYSKCGWIAYNSFLGNKNRYGIEPSQAQINKMWDLRGTKDFWENKILN